MKTFILRTTAVLAVTLSAAIPALASGTSSWQAAWGTALQPIPNLTDPPSLYKTPEVAGRTFRQIIYPELDGREARLRISNRYGTLPLIVEHAMVARSDGASGLIAGTSATVTFGGHASLTLAPGAEADSDALPFHVTHGKPLAISLTLGPRQTMQAWHRVANRVNFISPPGDQASQVQDADFRVRTTHYAWVTQLLVPATGTGTLVAIGDSITDGMRSSFNARHSWPEALAQRSTQGGLPPLAVLNAGISGNRLLSDSPCYGERLTNRFTHDAATVPGVRAVILLIGINDINFSATPSRHGLDCDAPHTRVGADDLINGYEDIIAQAHRRGLRIYGGTLTPADLPATREAIRQAINHWIRRSKAFDGVIDFDTALRDPRHPTKLLPAYDSGDGIHPSDAGYAAMAKLVPLTPLRDILSHH